MYSASYQNYLVLTVVRVFCGVCVCVRACVRMCHQLLPVEADAAAKPCCLTTEHLLISGWANFELEGRKLVTCAEAVTEDLHNKHPVLATSCTD